MTEFFSNVKDILNGVQFKNLNPVFAQIIADWNKIIGKKFANKTELKDIVNKNGNYFLIVNVYNSAILQELTFFKHNLIKKIFSEYGVELQDITIKLSKKTSNETFSDKPSAIQETYAARPDENELNNIELNDAEIKDIQLSIENQKALSAEQKSRMLEIIINDLKTQKWMKNKGFPVCKKCGRVLTSKIFGADNICKFCLNEENKDV